MAIHAPITGAPTRAPSIHRIEPEFALFNREAIEGEIERLIALLDTVDGDPDLEPEDDRCLAGDDGCGALRDFTGNLVWGSHEEHGSDVLPCYGLDQTAGPINLNEVSRAYYRSTRTG